MGGQIKATRDGHPFAAFGKQKTNSDQKKKKKEPHPRKKGQTNKHPKKKKAPFFREKGKEGKTAKNKSTEERSKENEMDRIQFHKQQGL